MHCSENDRFLKLYYSGVEESGIHSNWVFTNWFESIRTWVIEPRTILGWKNQERRNSFKLFTNWSLSKRTSKIIPALIIRPQIYTVVRWSSFTEAIVPFGCVWNRSSGTCKNIGAFPLFIVDAYPVGITNTYTRRVSRVLKYTKKVFAVFDNIFRRLLDEEIAIKNFNSYDDFLSYLPVWLHFFCHALVCPQKTLWKSNFVHTFRHENRWKMKNAA